MKLNCHALLCTLVPRVDVEDRHVRPRSDWHVRVIGEESRRPACAHRELNRARPSGTRITQQHPHTSACLSSSLNIWHNTNQQPHIKVQGWGALSGPLSFFLQFNHGALLLTHFRAQIPRDDARQNDYSHESKAHYGWMKVVSHRETFSSQTAVFLRIKISSIFHH